MLRCSFYGRLRASQPAEWGSGADSGSGVVRGRACGAAGMFDDWPGPSFDAARATADLRADRKAGLRELSRVRETPIPSPQDMEGRPGPRTGPGSGGPTGSGRPHGKGERGGGTGHVGVAFRWRGYGFLMPRPDLPRSQRLLRWAMALVTAAGAVACVVLAVGRGASGLGIAALVGALLLGAFSLSCGLTARRGRGAAIPR